MDETRAEKLIDDVLDNESTISLDYDESYLEGYFTADELEAIAWWMRNKCKPVNLEDL